MSNEEKILARLDELAADVADFKRAARPYTDLKEDLTPIITQIVTETISKLGGVEHRVDISEVADLIGTTLASSANLKAGVSTLNGLMDLKKDIEPMAKGMMNDCITSLDSVSHGFSTEALGELMKQTVLNLGNLAEGLKTISALMDLKDTAGDFSQQIFNDMIEQLDDLKKRGVLDGLAEMKGMGERLAIKMGELDLSKAKPVTGVFGMMGALKRPEVQEGMGVMLEMASVLSALKKPE